MWESSIPTPAVSRSECHTEWEWRYHVYRVHERRWDRLYDSTGRWALKKILTESKPQEKRIALLESEALAEVNDEDIRRAVELNEFISEEVRYDTPSVFDDAYHAGLYLAISSHTSEDIDDYYRGERLAGRALRPSLYHDVDYLDPDPSDVQLVEERLQNLRRFVHRLQELYDLPSETYTDADLVAIAQHYRWELSDAAPDVGTWLLDVTSSPFTALLFATYSEKKSAGDTGIVFQFDHDWIDSEFSRGAGFRQIVPAGVPRIVRQDATFLEMHPELLNQFVAMRILFEQQPDLVFEDPYLGITVSRLFPEQDRLQHSLQSERLDPPLTITDIENLEFDTVDEPPTSDVAPPFELFWDNTRTYDRLVEWIYADIGHDPSALGGSELDALHDLGRFHAFLQRELLEERATPRTSINRLWDAVGEFGDPGSDHSVEAALESGYGDKLAPDFDVIVLWEEFGNG